MLLKLSDDNLQHLSFLHDANNDVVKEFVDISLQFLTSGMNKKIFKVAAQKLQADENVVENAVVGLMQLFAEATKYKLNNDDLYDSLVAMGFAEQHAETIKDAFSSTTTRRALNNCASTLPGYDNLEWRLDVKLSTRSLHQQLDPVVRMKLHTSDGEQKNVHFLQTDPVNLLHMSRVVEEALDEMKSNHVRRILRNIA